jgi:lipoyl(octanoyl) transferase
MTHDQTFLLLESGPGEAAFNMAVDEILLESAPSLVRPVLRFYGWTDPAASFGYFQHIAEIERITSLRPLVRRPTGGGLVPHRADWTYSLSFPPGHPWYELRAEASYERTHRWLQAAFAHLGVPTEVAAVARKVSPGQCFAGYEKSDLLWQGRKIAGAAQRRTRAGLLIQGSVQPQPPGVTRDDWHRAMTRCATETWGTQWQSWFLPEAFLERIHRLASEKYSQDAYNRRR